MAARGAAVEAASPHEVGSEGEAGKFRTLERVELALRAAGIGLWEVNVDRGTLHWSEQHERLAGLEPGTFDGTTAAFLALVHPDDRDRILGIARHVRENGNLDGSYRIVWPDGTVRWLEGKGTVFVTEDDEVVGIGTTHDITERREAEQKAVEILESIRPAFFAVERDWSISYVNGAAEALLGVPRDLLLGTSLWAIDGLVGSPFEPHYRRAMDGLAAEFEELWEARRRWLDVRTYPTATGMSIYLHDVTAQRELEDRLRESEKLQAVGRLAGGIAHDFNNSLQVILGYAGLLDNAVSGTPHAEQLAHLRTAAKRSAGLTKQLLAFSRKQALRPQRIDANAFLGDGAVRLQRLLGDHVVVTTALEATDATVEADPTQLEQIVLNLGTNARDAMPRGGRFHIATTNVALDEEWLRGKETAAGPGRYICIRFGDTGPGIDPEIRERLFEPFFTTKPVGSGTGLGLPSVYGIVEQSGGHIAVEDGTGSGATFAVYLPVVADAC